MRNNRKDRIDRLARYLHNTLGANIQKEMSANVVLVDKKENVVGILQYGDSEPYEPIATLFNSENGIAIFASIAKHIDDSVLEKLYEYLGDVLEEDDDEEEDWKVKGKTKGKKKSVHGNVPCHRCANFREKEHHFGACRYHKEAFDGEEKNRDVSGCEGGCGHFKPMR